MTFPYHRTTFVYNGTASHPLDVTPPVLLHPRSDSSTATEALLSVWLVIKTRLLDDAVGSLFCSLHPSVLHPFGLGLSLLRSPPPMPNLHEDKGVTRNRSFRTVGGVGGVVRMRKAWSHLLSVAPENFGRRHQSVRDEDLRRVRTRAAR